MRILVIDDDEITHKFFTEFVRIFNGEVLNAYTSEEAEKMLSANPGIAAIVVDGHLGEEPNTVSLVTRIREKYLGPIWGYTGDPGVIALLEKAGCDTVFKKTPDKSERNIRDQLASFLTKK